MKTLSRILIFLVIAIVCFATAGILIVSSDDNLFDSDSKLAQQYDEEFTEPSSDITKINIDVVSSDIEFYTHEEDLVKVIIKGKSLILGMKDEREFQVGSNEGVLEINENQERKAWFGATIYNDINIKVYIPSDYTGDIIIKAVSSDIEISTLKVDNRLEIETVSGDIELVQMTVKELSLVTVSGDIDLEDVNADSSTIKTVSGDIEGKRVHGDISMKTTSGDIDLIYMSETFNLYVETISGDVELNLLNHVEFIYDFSTTSGDIDVRLDGLKKSTGRDISGQFGDTNNKIIIKTVSGDIELD
jgi:lia operon protein LiaG